MHTFKYFSHIHLKLVNPQRECIKIDIHWVGVKCIARMLMELQMSHMMSLLKWQQNSKHHSGEAVIFANWRLILSYDTTCHKKTSKTFFFFFCSLCVNASSKCMSLCAHVRTCESLCAKGGAGLEDAGGTGKWYCFLSAGVCVHVRVRSSLKIKLYHFPQDHMVQIMSWSSTSLACTFPQTGWENGSHWEFSFSGVKLASGKL